MSWSVVRCRRRCRQGATLPVNRRAGNGARVGGGGPVLAFGSGSPPLHRRSTRGRRLRLAGSQEIFGPSWDVSSAWTFDVGGLISYMRVDGPHVSTEFGLAAPACFIRIRLVSARATRLRSCALPVVVAGVTCWYCNACISILTRCNEIFSDSGGRLQACWGLSFLFRARDTDLWPGPRLPFALLFAQVKKLRVYVETGDARQPIFDTAAVARPCRSAPHLTRIVELCSTFDPRWISGRV